MSTFNHGSWKISCGALGHPPPPPPNETKCELDIRAKCNNDNKTACMACAAKLPCPQPCIDVHGNCTATWISAACTPPPPPPPPQELECIATIEKACAQNHSAGHPYAKNQSMCLKCAAAITPPCPKTCTMPGPKNTTVCEKAWISKGCTSMIPPVPPRPPPPPKPPVAIGPAHCIITVGVLENPFDPTSSAVVPITGGVFDSVETGTEILFDASTRASRRVRHNEDDFLEIWAQVIRFCNFKSCTSRAHFVTFWLSSLKHRVEFRVRLQNWSPFMDKRSPTVRILGRPVKVQLGKTTLRNRFNSCQNIAILKIHVCAQTNATLARVILCTQMFVRPTLHDLSRLIHRWLPESAPFRWEMRSPSLQKGMQQPLLRGAPSRR